MKIIINADDFGKNSTVNNAIVYCFNAGLISNTTIMVNMPGYDEAIKLARENGFFDMVGLHLNFFAGEPLTDEMKQDSILSKNGVMTSDVFFHKISFFRRMILNRKTRRNIKLECEAQVRKFIDSGFTQRHFDSHGHSHTIWVFWRIIRKTLKRYGFKSTRISENKSKNTKIISKIYKKIFNISVSRSFKTTDYFCSMKNMNESFELKNKSLEIMVHPDYENGKLVNRYGTLYTDYPALQNHLREHLISFDFV